MLSVEKELLDEMAGSPVDAYYAVCVEICRINPAKFIHLVIPFLYFQFTFAFMQHGQIVCFKRIQRKIPVYDGDMAALYYSFIYG